jgi:SAM-dependent methyltransferase
LIKLNQNEFINKNREAWNEVTPIHVNHRKEEAKFFQRGGSTLDHVELKLLPDLRGKKVGHLCCNCGQDTLSLANLGAKCVGFDFSGAAISEARRLSAESRINVEFVESNVLDIPQKFYNKFDLIYISKGVLVWIPEVKQLIKSVSKLLHKGGKLFLYDQHPFTHILASDQDGDLVVKFDYFKESPNEYKGLDYLGGTEYDALPNYQFMVRLSDVLNGISESGMKLELFKEYDHSMFQQFLGMVKCEDGLFRFPKESGKTNIPLMMALMATLI